MIISQEPEEIRNAIALQVRSELKRVVLRSCRSSVENTERIERSAITLRLSHSSTANPVVDGILRIEVKFDVHGESSAEPPTQLFLLECAFDLDYELDDKSFLPSSESVAAFKDGNAIFNCWPYTREFVHNIAIRMALDLPPLPFLRIVPKSHPPEPQPAPAERKSPSKRSMQRVRNVEKAAGEVLPE